MIVMNSTRLQIRTITPDDLAAVFSVHVSDPDFLRFREGSRGEPGRYDLEAWERDWQVAQFIPGRHALACYLEANGECVGYIDYLEEQMMGIPGLGL